MCGIHCIWDKKNTLSDTLAISKMVASTAHRGKDGDSFQKIPTLKGQLFLGHNLLKIVDCSDNSRQPLFAQDQGSVLVFNGEIYNWQLLRQKLYHKYPFSTNTDTEVLLFALIDQEEKCIPEFNGMFAFVYYNISKDQLIIGRDESGIKPLYYYEDENFLILSSEIQGILASGLVAKKLNSTQIQHYLKFKFANSPETFFKNIFVWEGYATKNLSTNTTHTFDYPKEPILTFDCETPLSTLFEQYLNESIALQTKSQVSRGVFWSGGIDSTLLMALSHEIKADIPAFTIVFPDQYKSWATSDAHYARKIARQQNWNLNELEIKLEDLKALPDFFKSLDQPIADPAYFLTERLSAFVSNHSGFCLSGAGADELFAGYSRHRAFNFYLRYKNYWHLIFSIIKSLPTFNNRLLAKLVALTPSKGEDFFVQLTRQVGFKDIDLKGNFISLETLQEVLSYERTHYLVQDVLALTDVASMHHSLEIRVPYLDKNILRFAEGLTDKQLYSKGPKWMLKEILHKKGLKEVASRKKEGFGMPLEHWLRDHSLLFLFEPLYDAQNMIYQHVNYDEVQILIGNFLIKKQPLSSEIWTLLCLHYWLDHYFKK